MAVMIVFDFLLGNEDRHYNNFGVLFREGEFKVAPLFDFGLGLFEHDKKYSNLDLDNAILKMDGKPFNKSLLQPVEMLIHSGYADYVKQIIFGINIPERSLFPSELGMEYFEYALRTIREMI